MKQYSNNEDGEKETDFKDLWERIMTGFGN